MHLRFKVLQKVFRYIRPIYNYPHDKKEDLLKVIKSLTTTKTYIKVYIIQKKHQFKGISSLRCSKTCIYTCSCT